MGHVDATCCYHAPTHGPPSHGNTLQRLRAPRRPREPARRAHRRHWIETASASYNASSRTARSASGRTHGCRMTVRSRPRPRNRHPLLPRASASDATRAQAHARRRGGTRQEMMRSPPRVRPRDDNASSSSASRPAEAVGDPSKRIRNTIARIPRAGVRCSSAALLRTEPSGRRLRRAFAIILGSVAADGASTPRYGPAAETRVCRERARG